MRDKPNGTGELFDAEPLRTHREVQRSQRSVAFGTCPMCHSVKPVGLLRAGEHLVWRRHTYVTWNDVVMDCSASGVAVCVARDRANTLWCKHSGVKGVEK